MVEYKLVKKLWQEIRPGELVLDYDKDTGLNVAQKTAEDCLLINGEAYGVDILPNTEIQVLEFVQ